MALDVAGYSARSLEHMTGWLVNDDDVFKQDLLRRGHERAERGPRAPGLAYAADRPKAIEVVQHASVGSVFCRCTVLASFSQGKT